MNTATSDSWWVVAALAAKCGDAPPSTLLPVAAILFAALFLATSLLFWSSPGGPAWGRRLLLLAHPPIRAPAIPGPRGLPWAGSMALMAGLAHRRIADAAARLKAERLMAFSLGETPVVVTCHADVAREILNSAAFADRPVKDSAYRLLFNRAIGFAPYGAYWRGLRRVAAANMFCPRQVSTSSPLRADIAAQMVAELGKRAGAGSAVRVRDLLKRASLHNMMASVFGRRYGLGSVCPEVEELWAMVDEGYELLGKLNWADHLPFLAGFDLQKIRLRCSKLVPKVNRFVGGIVRDHRAGAGPEARDFVDVLLSLEGEDKLSESDMIAVLWEMIFRGTDTVAVLIEWVLARLVIHPDVQQGVRDEINRVVGNSRPVTESDISALHYLQAVVKEVLRLHPPGPLLSWARLAITDTIVDGKLIPAGTTAMVNMWAIARDPVNWSDPLSFRPERFLPKEGEPEFSILGSDLRLAPFGSGRRSCPGKILGLTTAAFWVATLVHEFTWSESVANPVRLCEVMKLSSEMETPLTAYLEKN